MGRWGFDMPGFATLAARLEVRRPHCTPHWALLGIYTSWTPCSSCSKLAELTALRCWQVEDSNGDGYNVGTGLDVFVYNTIATVRAATVLV